MKKLFLLLSIFNTLFCFSQNLTINISENHFGIDENHSLIVSHIENIQDYNNTSGFDEIIITLDQNDYSFNSIPVGLEYSNSYLITDTDASNQYTLYFTQLPIISIEPTTTIVDEPKVLANFIYSDDEQVLISNIGIEIRGGSSQAFPKKTYDLEFWEDDFGDETINVQFGDLRSDDDWILDALYNEPLRLRSYIANKLWLEIHTPYYRDEEPNAKSGANVKYVEMFLNGHYNGLYNLSEQVDKKQLKLKSFNDNMRGELYKGISWGASTFTELPNYDNESREWSGYEFKYPKEDEITDWANIYQFTDFVMNASDRDFINSIWSKFDVSNYSDYFIFLNLLRATDNTGKNIYLAKYNTDEQYFQAPWDLDGCFGTIWNGTNENITNDILSNGFISRVIDINPNNISSSIANKWFNFRNNTLSNAALSDSILDEYNFLQNNKVYEREALVYPNYPFNQEDLSYILTWLENRLAYLDTYFGNNLSIDDNISAIKTNLIYPNPAKDRIYITKPSSLIGKEFKVYNHLGQLTSRGVIENSFISIENLEIGYYLIHLDNNSYKFIKK
jgi:spore coat protein CotH